MDVHHHHGSDTTIIDEREGPATALIVLVVLALVGFLIWLFGFSGVVFSRGEGSTTLIEQNVENPPERSTERVPPPAP